MKVSIQELEENLWFFLKIKCYRQFPVFIDVGFKNSKVNKLVYLKKSSVVQNLVNEHFNVIIGMTIEELEAYIETLNIVFIDKVLKEED